MSFAAADLATLSRLLEVALELEPACLDPWLSEVAEEHPRVVFRLRKMLAEHRAPSHPSFLAHGPRLAEPGLAASSGRAGDLVGPYLLVREIGRGGMAVVWLADRPDGIVKRSVALKMPMLTFTSPTQVERFERERDLLALLTHPQIARLYDAGVTDSGQAYIVLEHVDGLPITEACDTRRLDVAARLRMFLAVLAAIAHAHKHLVVHRDIKPSNVFVDVDGEVKLLDFGVARLLDEPLGSIGPTPLTREGGWAMTPAYAAPEQMDQRPISTATDIYSLGVLLYELLAGTLPHAAAQGSIAEAVRATLHVEPARPSEAPIDAAIASRRGLPDPARLRSLLAGDLDTIVLKALRKEPGQRYGSIDAFADDVRNYLEHRPIAARPPSIVRRSRLFLRRHRAAGVAAALGLVIAVGFAVTAYHQHLRSVEAQARGDSVRDFMFDLVEGAEADERHPDSEPTGKQMVAAAVARARAGFRDQPRLRGELLSELGLMLRRLGEREASVTVLREALALLDADAPEGDAARNKTRARLAERELEDDRADTGTALAASVLASCVDGRECAKARQLANVVLCKVELMRGHPATALAHMRQAVRDAEGGFGPRHSETAVTLQGLAVVARQAGDLVAAQQALEQASSIARESTLSRADGIQLEQTRALVSFDLGDYADAAARLRALLAKTRDKEVLAYQWRLLATVELARGDVEAARAAADAALALPADAVEPWLAHQAHARALSLAGESAAAAEEMRSALSGLHDVGYSATTMEILRGRRFLAEMHVRAGETGVGLAELLAVAADQAKVQAGQEVELAHAYDLIGAVLRESRRAGESRDWHLKARDLLAARLPAAHPFRLRNALYLVAAAWREQPTPETAALLARDADAYRQLFPANSAWRRIVDRSRSPASCPAAQATACALFL